MSCYASTNRRSRQSTYRAVCGKRATLLGNVDRADRKPRCGAELTKRQDVEPPGIRGAGGNNRNTAPEYFGLMGVALAAAKAPERKRVPERLNVDPPSLADQSGASS